MSANGDGDGDSGPGRREVAHRLFAAEFDDATVSYAESDEERAPKYVVTPTGARVNRLFAVGVLTEVESVNEDVLRARVVDPTGAFVSYAGQYQPDAAAFFERTDPPAFVALTGKARTFEPDDGDRIYTSVRPESVSTVDAETRDRWTVSAAEATLRRVAAMAEAKSLDATGDDLRAALEDRGYDESLASGIPIALERYGTTTAYLDAVRQVALDALAVVAGDRDAVRSLDVAPDEAGTESLGPLPDAVGGASTGDTTTAATADAEGASDDATVEATTETATGAGADADAAEGATAAGSDPADGDEPTAAAADAEGGTEAASDAGDAATEESTAVETGVDDATDEPVGEADDDFGDADDLGDFDDDDLYELDEEERREVEESFDVGFESGAEVDDPGEADIDVPGPEDLDAESETAEPTDTEAERAAETDADAEDEVATGSEDDADVDADADDAGGAPDVNLETAAIEVMEELDDGDGADREAVVAAVVDEHGADPGAVADAIEDALMSGRCYEPTEDRLKAI